MRFENFDWIRQADGLIKKTPNGGYVMINEVGCCYGFSLGKLDNFVNMFNELLEQLDTEQQYKRITDTPVVCSQCREIVPLSKQDSHC